MQNSRTEQLWLLVAFFFVLWCKQAMDLFYKEPQLFILFIVWAVQSAWIEGLCFSIFLIFSSISINIHIICLLLNISIIIILLYISNTICFFFNTNYMSVPQIILFNLSKYFSLLNRFWQVPKDIILISKRQKNPQQNKYVNYIIHNPNPLRVTINPLTRILRIFITIII